MSWQDYLALGLFITAMLFVAVRSYRALFGSAKPGCGSGCSSCVAGSTPKQLLSIDSLPSEPRS